MNYQTSFLALADNLDLGIDNLWYHSQPHPIIAYYCQLKELLTIKQFLLVSTNEMFREQCGEFVHW